MKFLFILFSLVSFYPTTEPLEEFLDSNYAGGSSVFFETMYKAIIYPADARSNCRVGKLIAEISINKNGEINNIDFLGRLDYGIEEQVKETLMLSSGNWIKSDSDRKFEITIAYKLNDLPDIRGDITVTAYHNENVDLKNESLCETNEELLQYLDSCMANEDYKKAKKVTLELLRRDPRSIQYQTLDDAVSKILSK